MTRIVPQPATKGSQYWLQRLVAKDPGRLQPGGLHPLQWLSPRADDEFAEYRDTAMLERLGLGHLSTGLAAFWPARGPVWDGLARAGDAVVLIEAKSHIAEALSPPSAARAGASRTQIATAFDRARAILGADDRADWSRTFYQYANRLAHLAFLTEARVEAHLLLISFLGDAEMGGPDHAETWSAFYAAADHALGIPSRHRLRTRIHHVHPHVAP